MSCFVYILAAEIRPGRLSTYVGWTLDLERRLCEHNGTSKGAKSTRGKNWALVYAEKYASPRQAMKREYILKRNKQFRAELRAQWQQNFGASLAKPRV